MFERGDLAAKCKAPPAYAVPDFPRASSGATLTQETAQMGMKQTLEVINRMEADGVVGRYAISGAVAAYNYVEPAVTEDLGILISFDGHTQQPKSGLVALDPVLSYLQQRGYSEFRKEGLVIEGWPVQFLPVADDLDAEALAQAEEVEIEINPAEGSVKSRVLRPQHIVATVLRTGRPKDRIRIIQFLEENAVVLAALCDVIGRHGLQQAWQAFCHRAGVANPCDVQAIHEGR
jgi:hypothetical protein